MFEPSAKDHQEYGGYAQAELPSDLDGPVDDFIQHVVADGAAAVEGATQIASSSGKQVLMAYAERMTILAVRARDRTYLLRALVADIVAGYANLEREPTEIMALVERSAYHLEVSLEELFEEASGLVGPPGSAALMMWLTRPARSRDLASMHFVENYDNNGLVYRYDPDLVRSPNETRLN